MDIQDYNIGFKINKNYGIGLTFEDGDGCKCISVYDGGFPRAVKLNISSYVGISAFAIHSYGRLEIGGLSHKILKTGKNETKFHKVGDIIWTSGYGDSLKPESMLHHRIEINRKITKKDLKLECFKKDNYRLGDYTNRFSSKQYIIIAAKDIFKRVFEESWKLVIGDWWESEDKILASH